MGHNDRRLGDLTRCYPLWGISEGGQIQCGMQPYSNLLLIQGDDSGNKNRILSEIMFSELTTLSPSPKTWM
jgi:hypothetical protein